jgi:rod shape-determining protein MreB and related proteins
MLNRFLQQIWYPDVAIDLGTAYTRVVCAHRPLSFEMPSVCETRAALRAGVVVDPIMAAEVLRPALARIRYSGLARPRAIACAPSDTSSDEREAVRAACYAAGAGAVALMPEPLAAALGAGINIYTATPYCVLDIGDGVTDCAVIRNGRLVYSWAARIACSDLHTGVRRVLQERYTLDVTMEEARRITEAVGVSGDEFEEDGFPRLRSITARGTRCVTGEPADAAVPHGLIHESLRPLTERIAAVATNLLEGIASDERAEICREGLYLTGGGSLLPGMAERIHAATGIGVRTVPNPLRAVVGGAKRILPVAAEQDLWKKTR